MVNSQNTTFTAPTPPPGPEAHFGRPGRDAFLLDPEVIFVNHGSFGATPRAVLAAQTAWQHRVERQPLHVLAKELEPALRASADALARFLGSAGENLVFVDNATSGVNAVLRSLDFTPGDEILFTNHGYGAVTKAIRYVCQRSGARPVEARVPFPLESPDAVVTAVTQAITPRTRLAVLDHITSATALVLPIDRLVAACHQRGVPVLVDGAHGPGMVDIDLEALGADYYAGNCHKWLCAAKGTGFLWVRPDRQDQIQPPIISWGWQEGFTKAFDWPGTRDFSNWVSLPTALAFHQQFDVHLRHGYCNALAAAAARMLERAWGTTATAPPDMQAAMATIRLPTDRPGSPEAVAELHDRLIDEHRIEAPIIDFDGMLWLRICAQVYNEAWEYERLAEAVTSLLGPQSEP